MNGISLNSSFKIGAVATALCSMVPTAYNVGRVIVTKEDLEKRSASWKNK